MKPPGAASAKRSPTPKPPVSGNPTLKRSASKASLGGDSCVKKKLKELEKTEAVVVDAKACLMKFSSESIMSMKVAIVDAVATKVDKRNDTMLSDQFCGTDSEKISACMLELARVMPDAAMLVNCLQADSDHPNWMPLTLSRCLMDFLHGAHSSTHVFSEPFVLPGAVWTTVVRRAQKLALEEAFQIHDESEAIEFWKCEEWNGSFNSWVEVLRCSKDVAVADRNLPQNPMLKSDNVGMQWLKSQMFFSTDEGREKALVSCQLDLCCEAFKDILEKVSKDAGKAPNAVTGLDEEDDSKHEFFDTPEVRQLTLMVEKAKLIDFQQDTLDALDHLQDLVFCRTVHLDKLRTGLDYFANQQNTLSRELKGALGSKLMFYGSKENAERVKDTMLLRTLDRTLKHFQEQMPYKNPTEFSAALVEASSPKIRRNLVCRLKDCILGHKQTLSRSTNLKRCEGRAEWAPALEHSRVLTEFAKVVAEFVTHGFGQALTDALKAAADALSEQSEMEELFSACERKQKELEVSSLFVTAETAKHYELVHAQRLLCVTQLQCAATSIKRAGGLDQDIVVDDSFKDFMKWALDKDLPPIKSVALAPAAENSLTRSMEQISTCLSRSCAATLRTIISDSVLLASTAAHLDVTKLSSRSQERLNLCGMTTAKGSRLLIDSGDGASILTGVADVVLNQGWLDFFELYDKPQGESAVEIQRTSEPIMNLKISLAGGLGLARLATILVSVARIKKMFVESAAQERCHIALNAVLAGCKEHVLPLMKQFTECNAQMQRAKATAELAWMQAAKPVTLQAVLSEVKSIVPTKAKPVVLTLQNTAQGALALGIKGALSVEEDVDPKEIMTKLQHAHSGAFKKSWTAFELMRDIPKQILTTIKPMASEEKFDIGKVAEPSEQVLCSLLQDVDHPEETLLTTMQSAAELQATCVAATALFKYHGNAAALTQAAQVVEKALKVIRFELVDLPPVAREGLASAGVTIGKDKKRKTALVPVVKKEPAPKVKCEKIQVSES